MITFLRSFRWHKDLWKPFLLDSVTILLIAYLWLGLGRWLNSKAYVLSQGRGLEELKRVLITNPESAQAFVANLKWFLVILIGGTLAAIILTLLLFSLSQALIWPAKFNKKRYWKWNSLNLILLLLLVPYLLLNLAANFMVNLAAASALIRAAVNGFFLILFLFFLFIVYPTFASTYRIGESISHSLKLFKNKFRVYAKAFLVVFAAGIVLSLALNFFYKKFYWLVSGWGKLTSNLIFLGIFLAYLAWMRFYVSRI
ncbi:MAG TPA: hypothetical protein VJH68_02375 [Candidatus Nanoarchaeia archaeon]|nr:hypothetical protein [Candidatus Nanoarchaeia archaeon]